MKIGIIGSGKIGGTVGALLARAGHVRVERIVSRGQFSAPGLWYDQEENELVVLVSGAATTACGPWPALPALTVLRAKLPAPSPL